MKTLAIFGRDVKVALRQFIMVWIVLAPILIAFIIHLVSPGIADTPVRLAMPTGDDADLLAYMQKYATVELFGTEAQLENRVLKRDDVPAIVPDGAGGHIILAQGNEPKGTIQAVKMFKTYAELGIEANEEAVEIHSFGRTSPPIKVILITGMVVLVTILSGMLIAISIVEEKEDRTIRAIRVAPVSIGSFVAGKSLLGVANCIVSTLLVLAAGGLWRVNLLQAVLIALAASLTGFVVGFLTGLSSDDFIGAAASIKILVIPAIAPILVSELAPEKWHRLLWWDPFYWAYRGIKGVLAQTTGWGDVLLCAGMVAGITALVYLFTLPIVKKKLV